MILVASSGVIGRLIYPKIHHGLYGRRASLRVLEQAAASQRDALGAALAGSPSLARALAEFEALATREAPAPSRRSRASHGSAGGLGRCAGSPRRTPGGGVDASRALASTWPPCGRWPEFSVYERIFSLWHAFHLPLCFLLFTATIVHVIAAHLY